MEEEDLNTAATVMSLGLFLGYILNTLIEHGILSKDDTTIARLDKAGKEGDFDELLALAEEIAAPWQASDESKA